MDRGFLEEYWLKERKDFQKFLNQRAKGRDSSVYPAPSRFVGGLKNPTLYALQRTHCYSDRQEIFWSQVPFAGSLIVVLKPVPERRFKRDHGFEAKRIPELVEFAKETGKINFVLAKTPLAYDGLDFLDPILTELKPPMGWLLPIEWTFSSEATAARYIAEFNENAQPAFEQLAAEAIARTGYVGTRDDILGHYRDIYLLLRLSRMRNTAKGVMILLRDHPLLACSVMDAYSDILFQGFFRFMPAPQNIELSSLNVFRELNELFGEKPLLKMIAPHEVGVFLMKKLTPYAPSFEAMQFLYDRYREEKLYNVMEALHNAIRSESSDLVFEKAEDMEDILDNVWKDARKVGRSAKLIDYSVSLTIGVVGPIAGQMLAGTIGLLAALGFSVGEKTVGFFDNVGLKISKRFFPSELANIYEFQKNVTKN